MPDGATELLDPPAADTVATSDAVDKGQPAELEADDVIAADLLVEEISIDGMCGVY
jgi:mycofactocin precursor